MIILSHLTKLTVCILNAVVVFVCLIGAAEIKSYGCISDNDLDDTFDYALQEFNYKQELQRAELENSYYQSRPTLKNQSTQTDKIIFVTAPPPFYVKLKSFFQMMKNTPHRNFVILYCSVATVLAVDGLLSMRMAAYLNDVSLLHMGTFELISGTSLFMIPFLAFIAI